MSYTNIHTGVYEQIINRLFKLKLNEVEAGRFYIGKKLRIITTTYTGATDYDAIVRLASLPTRR